MRKIKRYATKITAAVLTLSLCFSMTALATETEIKKQQKETQKQLDAINAQMREIESQRSAIHSEIEALDSELVDLVLNLELLQGSIDAKEEEIVIAEEDLLAAQEREDAQYEAMKKRIQVIYEEGDVDYLAMFLQAESFSDFLNMRDFSVEIHEQDRALLNDYRDIKEEVAALKAELEAEKAEMEDLRGEYEIEKREVEASLAEKQAVEDDFDSQLADAKAKAQQYKNDLSKQQAKLKELERQRLAAQNTGGGSPGSSGSSGGGKGSSGGGVSVSGNSSRGVSIANYALQFVGNPYVYGGTSLTNGADCSGFTQSVFKHFGISLPRTSDAQGSVGQSVSYADAQAGDLIYYGGHVGIYLGGGKIVHASTERTGIKISNALYRPISSVRRCY